MAYREDMLTQHHRMAELQRELATLINKTGVDVQTNTPNHVLARYLIGCVTAWDAARRAEADRADQDRHDESMSAIPLRSVTPRAGRRMRGLWR